MSKTCFILCSCLLVKLKSKFLHFFFFEITSLGSSYRQTGFDHLMKKKSFMKLVNTLFIHLSIYTSRFCTENIKIKQESTLVFSCVSVCECVYVLFFLLCSSIFQLDKEICFFYFLNIHKFVFIFFLSTNSFFYINKLNFK